MATGRFRSGAELRAWIAQTYQVDYTVGGIYALLKRLRGRQKVPRPMHQRTYLARAGLSVPGPVGFADEMRLGLRGTVRRVWGLRGVKVRQAVQFTDAWRYLFLAVESAAGRLHWCWLAGQTAPMIRGALRGLAPAQLAGLVWDRAPSHRTKSIHTVDLPLIDLPPFGR